MWEFQTLLFECDEIQKKKGGGDPEGSKSNSYMTEGTILEEGSVGAQLSVRTMPVITTANGKY